MAILKGRYYENTQEYRDFYSVPLAEDIAPEYSTSGTYAVGDYVIYQTQLYKCKVAITTAEAWTAAHWESVTAMGEVKAVTDMSGDHDNLVAGSAKQLLSTIHTTNQEPYNFRAIPEGAGDREYLSVVGGTLRWNQLVKELNSTNWTAESGVTATYSNGVASISSTTASNGVYQNNSPVMSGHKYLFMCKVKALSDLIIRTGFRSSTGAIAEFSVAGDNAWHQLADIKASTLTETGSLYVYASPANYAVDVKEFIGTDLTLLFGTTIADYIYTLEQATAGAGVAWVKRYIDLDSYHAYSQPTIKSVEGLESHDFYDADENHIASYPLDSTITLRGIPKLDSDYKLYFDGDVYTSDGKLRRRYGERAYQSGDESLANAITDGTTTVYKLTTPTTETAQPFTSPQICASGGTEEFISDSLIPVGSIAEYPADLRKQIENIYGIPTPPSTNGNYRLRVTVSGGVPTFSWASDS